MNHNEHTEPRIYELGYHLVPTLSEEQIPGASGAVRGMIERISKDIVAEELPVFIDLAYQIVKTIDHKNKRFDEAYFGWIKFEGSPEGIAELEVGLKKDENVLRYLIVKTIRESTFIAKKFTGAKVKEIAESADSELANSRPGRRLLDASEEVAEEALSETSSEEVLDKAIEELVK